MTLHLWHNLSPGPQAPDVIYAVVEVPKGSRNKYEYSKSAGVIKLDRVLYSPLHYPGDYGFIPQSYYADGDPLDVLVMMEEPSYPGCVIEARPIGMLRLLDRGQNDDKILAVPATDPQWGTVMVVVRQGPAGEMSVTTEPLPQMPPELQALFEEAH